MPITIHKRSPRKCPECKSVPTRTFIYVKGTWICVVCGYSITNNDLMKKQQEKTTKEINQKIERLMKLKATRKYTEYSCPVCSKTVYSKIKKFKCCKNCEEKLGL